MGYIIQCTNLHYTCASDGRRLTNKSSQGQRSLTLRLRLCSPNTEKPTFDSCQIYPNKIVQGVPKNIM